MPANMHTRLTTRREMKETTKVQCPTCQEETKVEHSTYEAVGYCPICGVELTTENIDVVD
jgi:transcription elongation factor Elf1